MAKITIKHISSISHDSRFDTEYFIDHRVYTLKTQPLTTFGRVVSGPFGSMIKSSVYQNVGIPFIRVQDVLNVFINPSSIVYISTFSNSLIPNSQLTVGDLVLSKVGNSIGHVAQITENIGLCNISENNIGIRLSDTKYSNVILAYLNCSYGQSDILKRISGNAQPKLNVKEVANLAIPIFSSSLSYQINKIVKNANLSYYRSLHCYKQAQLVFNNAIYRHTNSTENVCARLYSLIIKQRRLDPEFWQSIITLKNQVVRFFDRCTLVERLSTINNNRIDYIELSNVNTELGTIDSYSTFTFNSIPSRAKRQVFSGDLLLSTVEGSIDKIALISGNENGYFASSGFLQIRPKDCTNEYLLIFFKSVFGQQQLRKICGGSILSAIQIRLLDHIAIPITDKKNEEEITNLVQQSHQLHRESKRLLEVAKKAVEIAIEESEEKAMQYLNENQATSIEY